MPCNDICLNFKTVKIVTGSLLAVSNWSFTCSNSSSDSGMRTGISCSSNSYLLMVDNFDLINNRTLYLYFISLQNLKFQWFSWQELSITGLIIFDTMIFEFDILWLLSLWSLSSFLDWKNSPQIAHLEIMLVIYSSLSPPSSANRVCNQIEQRMRLLQNS